MVPSLDSVCLEKKTEISIPVFFAVFLLSALFSSSKFYSFIFLLLIWQVFDAVLLILSLLRPLVVSLLQYSFVQPICPSFLHVQIRFPYHALLSRPLAPGLLHLEHSFALIMPTVLFYLEVCFIETY